VPDPGDQIDAVTDVATVAMPMVRRRRRLSTVLLISEIGGGGGGYP